MCIFYPALLLTIIRGEGSQDVTYNFIFFIFFSVPLEPSKRNGSLLVSLHEYLTFRFIYAKLISRPNVQDIRPGKIYGHKAVQIGF